MKLADKVRYLREVEGSLRGLGRAMTQQELVKAIAAETKGKGLSQSYLSQLESGTRPHLTNTTRLLLAKFFKVHPGYLVEDPEDFQAELRTAEILEDKLDLWLVAGAERFGRKDPDLCRALLAVSQHADSRRCLLLLEAVLKTPALVDRLGSALGWMDWLRLRRQVVRRRKRSGRRRVRRSIVDGASIYSRVRARWGGLSTSLRSG